MILIVGGSGYLGRELASRLIAGGRPVRIMTRNPASVEQLREAGATVVKGDLIDPASVARACEGVDVVYAAAHSLPGRGKYRSEAVDDAGHRGLIDAAKAAGAGHFIYFSVLDPRPDHPIDFFRTKYRIEEYLKESGMNYTILRASAFMELHVHNLNGKGILDKGKTSLLGTGNKPRNYIAVRDVAWFGIRALTDESLKNRTLEIGGPDHATANEVAELYGKLAGITPKISRMPPAVAKVMSRVFRPFHPGLSRIMHLGSQPDDAWNETFDTTALLNEFPVQLTTLEQFIRERISDAGKQPV
jgi:uncharacterized protein YbjT (DUF2867 family)